MIETLNIQSKGMDNWLDQLDECVLCSDMKGSKGKTVLKGFWVLEIGTIMTPVPVCVCGGEFTSPSSSQIPTVYATVQLNADTV